MSDLTAQRGSEGHCGQDPSTAQPASRVDNGRNKNTADRPASVQPRLLDLHGAAAYLGVSGWTVRDLEHAGILARIRVPLPDGGELRKLLFDRADLDHLIERWKESTR